MVRARLIMVAILQNSNVLSSPGGNIGRAGLIFSHFGNMLTYAGDCQIDIASVLDASPSSRGATSHLVCSRQPRDLDGPSDVKTMFGGNVDFVRDNRIIFDIGGNKYRLIIHADYAYKRVLIKFIGTHSHYDRIDPETV